MKKETLAQVLSGEFGEISKNSFFYKTPLVAASAAIPCWWKTLLALKASVLELISSVKVDGRKNIQFIKSVWSILYLELKFQVLPPIKDNNKGHKTNTHTHTHTHTHIHTYTHTSENTRGFLLFFLFCFVLEIKKSKPEQMIENSIKIIQYFTFFFGVLRLLIFCFNLYGLIKQEDYFFNVVVTKGHTYLNKPAAFISRFVYTRMTFSYHQEYLRVKKG